MNIEVDPLPEGCQLLEAVLCYRALDADGDVCFGTRATDGLRIPDAVGMMQMAIAEQTKKWLEDEDNG